MNRNSNSTSSFSLFRSFKAMISFSAVSILTSILVGKSAVELLLPPDAITGFVNL